MGWVLGQVCSFEEKDNLPQQDSVRVQTQPRSSFCCCRAWRTCVSGASGAGEPALSRSPWSPHLRDAGMMGVFLQTERGSPGSPLGRHPWSGSPRYYVVGERAGEAGAGRVNMGTHVQVSGAESGLRGRSSSRGVSAQTPERWLPLQAHQTHEKLGEQRGPSFLGTQKPPGAALPFSHPELWGPKMGAPSRTRWQEFRRDGKGRVGKDMKT